MNLPKAILFLLFLLSFPLFSLLLFKQGVTSISTIYQVIGIFLLYFDERYKMDHKDRNFSKLNSRFISILESWGSCKLALKEIYDIYKNSEKKDIYGDLSTSGSVGTNDYQGILDHKIKLEIQLKSMETDLENLRYFSEVRKTGYILIAIGYILQFLLSLCLMFSLCFCSS